MTNSIYTIKIAGAAGQGIKSAGLMFAKVATRSGYNVYSYIEYPSLVRGGHNVMAISISKNPVKGPSKKTDLIIALNQDTINRYISLLSASTGIIFDESNALDISKINSETPLCPIPLGKLANTAGNKDLLLNTVAMGATLAILGADLTILKKLIQEEFAHKSTKVIDMNLQAVDLGYSYAKEHFVNNLQAVLQPLEKIDAKMIVDGNEAVALGAIAGGLQFAAIYPMSPISNILHVLAANQEKYGYIYKQPEDEIAAVNMAIGASFAGARSLTATSGGGFCLMTEGLGLAAMVETPVVIINGMRPGPATGLATWSGQGDLQFALRAHQGDFPRIVLAPGDAQETFKLTMQAFNLADKYQTPVILLIDKNICENQQSFPVFDIPSSYEISKGKFNKQNIPDYKRFKLEKDGISTRTTPGSLNYFIANSYEHDETGYSTEDVNDIKNQMEKRMAKLKTCEDQDMEKPQLFGPEIADLTLVSWGSNKGSILQALEKFENVNFLHITWMSPFPTKAVKNVLGMSKHIIDIECNYTGQLANLIREKTGIEITDKLLKYDGRPFFVEEITEKINSVLNEKENEFKMQNSKVKSD